jgi:hypothetical protein
MQPRAFVVMPFGQKPPGTQFTVPETNGGRHEPVRGDARPHPPVEQEHKIDFESLYSELLEHALRRAGYQVARGDSEASAGDIRTDMFFELVTADLVVADISILNPNVYYELGVRHGVCPRGVFVVSAKQAGPMPFDVAPDRRFTYDAEPFIVGDGHETGADDKPRKHDEQRAKKVQDEVERLARTFREATAVDGRTVGSPVYQHLPGLKEVNWDDIETSKARYFSALQNDWRNCVRMARARRRPGDILTLARNAPTRFHEARILFEAAKALIDLCRYSVAESVLKDVVQLEPDNLEAQIDLALVEAQRGAIPIAEQRLRTLLEQHKDDPRADDQLGDVLRHLWRLSWQSGADRERWRERARESASVALSAIRSFVRAHRADPLRYFAGFNALILAFVLEKLGVADVDSAFGQIGYPGAQYRQDLAGAVRFAARIEQRRALEAGDYETQFWCTTALAGLQMIEGNTAAALHLINEACAIPAATSFQLQTFRNRLHVLLDLDIQAEAMHDALDVVGRTFSDKMNQCTCRRVVLWYGYAGEGHTRHAAAAGDDLGELSAPITDALKDWNIGENDLAICGGMNESDIVFAEACHARGARVRIMLRERTESEMEHLSNGSLVAESQWRERLLRLRLLNGHETWIDAENLGPVRAGDQNPRDVSIRRHQQWLLNTAAMEASQTSDAGAKPETPPPAAVTTLHALVWWNGSRNAADPADPSELIREVGRFDSYRGTVRVIAPGAPAPAVPHPHPSDDVRAQCEIGEQAGV